MRLQHNYGSRYDDTRLRKVPPSLCDWIFQPFLPRLQIIAVLRGRLVIAPAEKGLVINVG